MRSARRASPFLVLALLLAACGASTPSSPPTTPPASETPNPSESAGVPTAEAPSPSAEPSAAPTNPPPAVVLKRDSYARVITDDLRLRSKPGVSADSRRLEPLLADGVRLLVVDGPVAASGYAWYQVQPIVPFESELGYPFGWVAAASQEGEPWLEAEATSCPPMPTDVASLALLNETERDYFEVTCFGGAPIEFTARLGTPEAVCGVEAPWGVDPIWFDTCVADGHYLVPVEGGDRVAVFPTWMLGADFSIDADPGAPREDLPVVAVTGQFDHEAAQSCRARQNYAEEWAEEPDPALVVLECRAQFVVTSLKAIG